MMTSTMRETGCIERKFNVGIGEVAAKQWGENLSESSKVLAIHGYIHNAASFDPLMVHFSQRDRCVVSMDLPGHGLSSHHPPGFPYSGVTELQAIRSVIQQLDWPQFSIIGHSMGGMRALEYALCWPNEVASIICIDALLPVLESIPLYNPGISEVDPFAMFGEKTDKYLRASTSGRARVREYDSWESLRETWLSADRSLDEENLHMLMKRGCKKLDNEKYVTSHDLYQHHRVNVLLKVPQDILLNKLKSSPFYFLLIRASRGMFSKEFSSHFQLAVDSYKEVMGPRFQDILLDGTHNLHMQEADSTCRVIEKFLTEVNASQSKL